jgi:hypothetical protein
MFIRDPGSELFLPGSRIQGRKDSGSASKNLSILNPKKYFYALGKLIWDVHPRSRVPDFFPIPDQDVKKAPDPRSASATLTEIKPTNPRHVIVKN